MVDHRYAEDEKEGPIVREIFRLYTEDGLNMLQISQKLAKFGYTRNDGRAINHALVEKILANTKYIGILKSSKFVNDEGCPKVVDKDVFDRAQRRRQSLKHIGGAFKKDVCFSLTGLVFCGECGRMVTGDSGTSHTGRIHSYYKCKGRKHRRCDLPTYRKESLEEGICLAIVRALKDPKFVKPLAKSIYDQQDMESPEVKSVRDKLKDIQTRKTNLMNAIMMGVVTDSTKSTLLELEADENKFEATLSELQVQHRKFTKQEIEASLEILADKPYNTDMEKKELFTRLVQRVEIFKDGYIKIYISIFGVKTEINAIDTSKSKVELQILLSRHSYFLRAIIVNRYGIVFETRLDHR